MADYVLNGFSQGFRLGLVGKKPLRSSTDIGPQISTSLLKELNRGHIARPFLSLPFKVFHLSPLGGVPRKDGTTRIILDLSSPVGVGSSVNNGISREAFSVKYATPFIFNTTADALQWIAQFWYEVEDALPRHYFFMD